MVMVMNPPSSSSERAHLTDGDELTTELGVQSRSISIGVSPGDIQVKPPGPPPNRRDRCCVRTIAAVLACIALVMVFHVAIATWHYFNPAYDGIAEGVPYETARQHEQQPEDLWGAVKRPYPTGAWWTNLVVADGNGPVAPLPYGVMVKRSGVDLSYHGAVKVPPSLIARQTHPWRRAPPRSSIARASPNDDHRRVRGTSEEEECASESPPLACPPLKASCAAASRKPTPPAPPPGRPLRRARHNNHHTPPATPRRWTQRTSR